MPTQPLHPPVHRAALRRTVLALAIALAPAAARAADVPAAVPPIACSTPQTLYRLLNAADDSDRIREAQIAGAACQPLSGLHYNLVAERDGVVTIRIFPRPGDWSSSRLAFTLDEMVTPDDLPGSPEVQAPAGPSS